MNVTLTDANFDSEAIHSARPVLVYFWAEWCEEHRFMSPIIEAIARAKVDSQVGSLNVDENPRMARKYLIQTVPTTILFVNGSERDRIEGVTNQIHLSRTIDMHLSDIANEPTADS